jgi:hypothetical protein
VIANGGDVRADRVAMHAVIPGTEILSALGARLSATPNAEGELHAVIDGIPVEVRLAIRSQGSSSSKWTEFAVKSEHLKGFAFTFNFDVRATQTGDATDVRDGRLRDIVTGDAAFDEAFVVEAAPEDVVRVWLDAAARAEMLALRPIRVISTPVYAVMIERLDWVGDVDLLERLTKLTVRLAASLVPAAREAAQDKKRAAPKGGYRDRAPTDAEIRAGWDADVLELNAQAERRRIRSQKIGIAIALGVLVIVMGGIALVASR